MDHLKHHLKHMAIGGVAIVGVLAIAGVDLGQALRWGILLACPIGMIAMMAFMGRHRGEGAQPRGVDSSKLGADTADAPPATRHH